MNLSPHVVPYILYQRTGYAQQGIGALLSAVERRIPMTYKACTWLRSRLCAEMLRDFEQIRAYLPKKESISILDIGCGIGGVHPFINNEYHRKAFFTMYDKTKTEKRIWYEFKQQGAFYNDLSYTKQFLVENGISEAHVETLEASEHPVFSRKYDLITSFISWGWHYPLSTYWDVVLETLQDDGVLILDIRSDQRARKIIESAFEYVETIDKSKRGERVAAWGKRTRPHIK
jgi:SAM-dependent methyltransferase